jgi:cystathionine beta-lyase/cystathionine gamma-synthase
MITTIHQCRHDDNVTHKESHTKYLGFATRCIHGGVAPDPVTGAILTPIYQSATYVQESVGHDKGYTYSRSANPTVTALDKKIGELEGIKSAVCYATGMAATTALFLAVLKSGDHVVCGDVVYGGTVRLLRQVLQKFDVIVSFVDTSDPANIKKAITKNTKIILLETPANPTLKLGDIAAITAIAREHEILSVVDNTFLTAALQKPFQLGADIILYSTTKYIDGHNATVGGALLAKDDALTEKFDFIRNATGTIQAPFNAWLILQGIKTLELRLQQHSIHAEIVANHLAQHPKIKSVTYPGLTTFPQYELAKRQQLAFGGIIAFEVVGGYENAVAVMNSVKLCALAENLGAVETLITHPASMTHSPIPQQERYAVGITDSLIRLSVGLENPADIIADLEQALSRCRS